MPFVVNSAYVLLILLCFVLPSFAADEPSVSERPVQAGETKDGGPAIQEELEKILSQPVRETEDQASPAVNSGSSAEGPNSVSPVLDRVRQASMIPGGRAVSRDGSSMLDTGDFFDSSGALVGDPVGIYSDFAIEVEKSTFTVKLYGYRNGEERTLLYSCKAGLGSPEYPTPKGSFYIVRIFDDKPLWIPPPRDWAYGESPSRSVYGGHMMPFFKKVLKPDKDNPVIEDLDNVAPIVEMEDTGTYRIHGTSSPWSIGSGQSHGCVRLLNKTVAQLVDVLKMYVGTTTRGETPNGVYINLARPVKLTLFDKATQNASR